MEPGLASDEIAVVGEGDAALGDDCVEFCQSPEVPVDDRLVEMDPKGFGRLEFWSVGRQVNETDAFGNGKRGSVPTGAVEHEDDDPVASCTGLAGKEREGILKESLVDAGSKIP
jgi:hypothetical protein